MVRQNMHATETHRLLRNAICDQPSRDFARKAKVG